MGQEMSTSRVPTTSTSSSSSSSNISDIQTEDTFDDLNLRMIGTFDGIIEELELPPVMIQNAEQMEKGTPKAAIAILQYEIEKLDSLKSLAEELRDTPPNTKPATIREIKKMILEELPTLVSGKIKVNLDSPDQTLSFITQVTERISQINQLLIKPDEIPHEVLVQYKNEITRRETDIAWLTTETNKAIQALQMPNLEKGAILQVDEAIGEMLVMKELLDHVIDIHLQENLAVIKFAKSTFGCQIEPLQLLNVTKIASENNNNLNAITQVAQGSIPTFPQTISMDKIDSSTDTYFMRRRFSAEREVVDLANIPILASAMMYAENLIPRVIEEEERMIETLTHCKAFASELLSNLRGPNIQILKTRFDELITRKIEIELLSTDMQALLQKFKQDLETQQTGPIVKPLKTFSLYFTNRLIEAKNNIKAMKNHDPVNLPTPGIAIIKRYRDYVTAHFEKIAALQNTIVTTQITQGNYNLNAGLEKGFCMRVVAQEVDRGQFLLY